MSQLEHTNNFRKYSDETQELNERLTQLFKMAKPVNQEIKKIKDRLDVLRELMDETLQALIGTRFHQKPSLRSNCMRISTEAPWRIEIYDQNNQVYLDAETFAMESLSNCRSVMTVFEKNKHRILKQHVEGLYQRINQQYHNFVLGHNRVETNLKVTEIGHLPEDGLPTVPERPFINQESNENFQGVGGPIRARRGRQRRQPRVREPAIERPRRCTRRPQLVESQLYLE